MNVKDCVKKELKICVNLGYDIEFDVVYVVCLNFVLFFYIFCISWRIYVVRLRNLRV